MQVNIRRAATTLALCSWVTLGTAFGQDKAATPTPATPPAQATAPPKVMEQGALDLVKKDERQTSGLPQKF